jgi:hypothetical protein
LDAQQHAEEIENLKRPFIQAWNSLASAFSCGTTSDYDHALTPISPSTCNDQSLSSTPHDQKKVVSPVKEQEMEMVSKFKCSNINIYLDELQAKGEWRSLRFVIGILSSSACHWDNNILTICYQAMIP